MENKASIRIVNLEDYELEYDEILYRVDETNSVMNTPFKTDNEEMDYENYENYFFSKLDNKDEDLRRELDKIYHMAKENDIALGCWCKQSELCYAEVIKRFLEQFI